MADGSKIEWTDATWQIVTGCSVVSPGCTNCYAMRLAGTRLQHHPSRAGLTIDTKAGPVWNGKVRFNVGWLRQPLQWKKPRDIFVAAHGDLFHDAVQRWMLVKIFAVMAMAHWHRFQVLTKRAENMRNFITWLATEEGQREMVRAIEELGIKRFYQFPLPNVWLGVSAEDQPRADERIPDLLATPAAVRFVSLEPLLGPLDLEHVDADDDGYCKALSSSTGPNIDWVIAGGESGPKARPSHPDWFRSLRDQCQAAGVPFFFKQWGEWAPSGGSLAIMNRYRTRAIDRDGNVPPGDPMTEEGCSQILEAVDRGGYQFMSALGKKRAGATLDGHQWRQFPR